MTMNVIQRVDGTPADIVAGSSLEAGIGYRAMNIDSTTVYWKWAASAPAADDNAGCIHGSGSFDFSFPTSGGPFKLWCWTVVDGRNVAARLFIHQRPLVW